MNSVAPLGLVTGASAGIGATFARALAARGYGLILVARRRERLDALATELEARHGTRVEVLAADLTDAADLQRVESRIAAAPDLELLVNNAGFGITGRFWTTSVDRQDRLHRLHVVATMRLTHAALGGMVPRGHGSVINVSSVAAFVQSPGSVTYNASKCWMNSFAEGLYLELQSMRSPVRIQALCPGFTYSEFHEVAGIDRKTIAAPLWTSAEQVVEASLAGLERGVLYVVPGWRYRLLIRLLAVAPNPWRRALSIKYARRMRRDRAAQ